LECAELAAKPTLRVVFLFLLGGKILKGERNMRTKGRLTIAVLGAMSVLALVGLALTASMSAEASSVEPTLVPGKPNCCDVCGCIFEYKIKPVEPGTYYPDVTHYVTITVSGDYMDWNSNLSMDCVIVKGGNNANLYDYRPGESLGDTGLHAPINRHNQKPYDLSHVSFCYDYEQASKSGMKFHDLDADGVKDDGEPGLEGWTIYVDYNDDGELDADEPSATTAADGSYTITGINPGTWKVREVGQAGWTQTYPASGCHEETFASGASLTDNDFGNWQVKAKIEISPQEDTNKVGEEHLLTACVYVDYGAGYALYTESITINFSKTGVGSLSATSIPTTTGCAETTLTTTEAGQSTVTAQAAFSVDGGAFDISTDATGDNSGPAEKDWETQTCAIICGYKWDDYDHDGEWDEGEPELPGWTINLEGPEGPQSVTTGTGSWSNGYYEFEICEETGTYTISEELLPGDWHRTFPDDPGTHEVSVFVLEGVYGDYNFGNTQEGYIQTCTIIYGHKWNDYDHDGMWDKPHEPPLKGWKIHLNGPVTGVAYTNAEGYYQFEICDVLGTFTVSEVMQAGWTRSYPSGSGIHQVVIDDLEKEYGSYDFGNYKSSGGVGGEAYPVDKLAILAPWIALFVAIAVGAIIL